MMNQLFIFCRPSIVYLCLFLMLVTNYSCTSHQSSTIMSYANHELSGVWSNDQDCVLQLGVSNNHLYLLKFIDKNHRAWARHILYIKKYSVTTILSAPNINWQATYTDGNLLINNYCSAVLHKEGNN